MAALDALETWPVDHCAAAVIDRSGIIASAGDIERRFSWASVTKLLTAWAIHIAIEEGSVTLSDPVGQQGCTLEHLLAHAGGYGFDTPEPLSAPGRTRMYSNTGYELAADHVARATGMNFAQYLTEAVLAPLEMHATTMTGSPAKDGVGPVLDGARFAHELLVPTLVHDTSVIAFCTVRFPDLSGVVPAIGRFDPCPWGLGPEIRAQKSPHWTGTLNSPETFGHFGGSGTFVWVDPVHDLALVALSNRPVGEWALRAWPALSDAVITEFGGRDR